ncbi:receptor-interacting serine/threonine-protein kinase 2-like [Acipenser oxyrinchus oxyrinchus]|uniref:Receptor-interacting serine/threonine-protein kinase 2 n=1 Tax=Acipenser oxyrinchus oxyrinchus TaxID=40147 RepID=A0AAD8GGL8_ACIOX|nr:receptor-interacting serine/threonine-protein kinase 2-like [Acipenser oxyrinchus oxyrinchus]
MEHSGCVNLCSLTSTLPVIPYQKLTDLHYLSKGGFGTVFRAQHSDWRTTVAIKCLKLDCPVGERERNSLLKEAEVLHKARFNYIIQIFGVCNEPEFFCIVTEYMSNGSLDQLLHGREIYPRLAWSLRLRILYEIALGVNFLHNMTPPLLHHDLKTQNILLDAEFHVKIADFGLSKWRQLSISKASGSKPPEMRGTVIYMPPEEYEPSSNRRTDVKHDMYSYSIIMWEALSRKIPFEEATNPMQIMFSVLRGSRPDTSEDSLPFDIPSRDTLIELMTSGWATNPDVRLSFIKCLIELEPMVRRFDEIDVLEAVLEVKKSKLVSGSRYSSSSTFEKCQKGQKTLNVMKNVPPWQDGSSASWSYSEEAGFSQPQFLTVSCAPPSNFGPSKDLQEPSNDSYSKKMDFKDNCNYNIPVQSELIHLNPLSSIPTAMQDPPMTLIAPSFEDNMPNQQIYQSARTQSDFNIPCKPSVPESECAAQLSKMTVQPSPTVFIPEYAQPGVAQQWIQARREDVVTQMTEACINQSLDALLSRELLMREDYELITTQSTRTAKVRKLLDTCDSQGEDFARIIVQKLKDNKQMGLQPYPDVSPTTFGASSLTFENRKNL